MEVSNVMPIPPHLIRFYESNNQNQKFCVSDLQGIINQGYATDDNDLSNQLNSENLDFEVHYQRINGQGDDYEFILKNGRDLEGLAGVLGRNPAVRSDGSVSVIVPRDIVINYLSARNTNGLPLDNQEFNNARRYATLKAGERYGFNVIRIQ